MFSKNEKDIKILFCSHPDIYNVYFHFLPFWKLHKFKKKKKSKVHNTAVSFAFHDLSYLRYFLLLWNTFLHSFYYLQYTWVIQCPYFSCIYWLTFFISQIQWVKIKIYEQNRFLLRHWHISHITLNRSYF